MSDSLVLLGVRILRSVKPSRNIFCSGRQAVRSRRQRTACRAMYIPSHGAQMQCRAVRPAVRVDMRFIPAAGCKCAESSANRYDAFLRTGGLFACPHSKECGRARPAVWTFFPVFRTLAERSNIGHRTIRPYPVLSPPLRQEAYGMKKRAFVTGNPFLHYRKTYSERGVTLTYDLPSPFLQNSTVPSTRANNV